MEEQRELTFGEKACGVSFNPGNREDVDLIKRKYADIVDLLAKHRIDASPEVARMLSIAITETQTAQMWAVKSVTWQF
jgi:hypothetical protein